MKLRSPILEGATSSMGNEMQRQVADRITARHEAEQRKKRRMEIMKQVKSLAGIVVMCVVAGCGWYLWKQGKIDQYLPDSFASGKTIPTEPDTMTNVNVLPKDVEPEDVLQNNSDTPTPVTSVESKIAFDERNELVDRYGNFAKVFKNVAPVRWKDAPDSDRPGKAGRLLAFNCIVPDKNGDPVFWEIQTPPKGAMIVCKLTANLGLVKMPKKDFDMLTSDAPYLVELNGRVYFATPNGWSKSKSPTVVTASFKSYNPSKMEFGRLYDMIEEMGLAKPKFKYDVYFDMKGSAKSLKVATVGYGEEVSRDLISKLVANQHGLDANDVDFMSSVLAYGTVRFVSSQ